MNPQHVDALEHDWTRLHPLSPVVQFSRGLAVVAIALVPRLIAGRGGPEAFIDLAVLVLGLIGGVVHWLVTRWRVAGAELQIETGLLRRQSIRVPLRRIRSVDLVRPALGRVFGLAEVRVEIAGQGTGRGRLAYLPEQRAVAVRAQLLALAHGLPQETPTPQDAPVWRVDNGRLVGSALLGGPAFSALLLVAGLVVTGVAAPRAVPGVLGAVVPLMLASLSTVARRVLAEWGFTLAVAGDGLRLTSGLVQTRAQTIPAGRVQAVRCTQPLWWRPLGWYRLEIDVARQRGGRRGSESDSARVSRAYLPVGTAAEVDLLLAYVVPGVVWLPPPVARPPGRAVVKAPLSYPALATWCDERYVATRTGRLRRVTMLVPLAKIQSVRWVQGPVHRALRLATVHVDLAGRTWRAAARCRDERDAAVLWTDLAAQARRLRSEPALDTRPTSA